MLLDVRVKNLALIQSAQVSFAEGLNILTGETGAGKSIVIGSVNAALGGKVSKDMIRQGADSLQDGLVQLCFRDAGGVGTPRFPAFDPADTPPHDFFAAVDVPGHPAVGTAAAAAHKALGKGVLAGEPAFVPPRVEVAPAGVLDGW